MPSRKRQVLDCLTKKTLVELSQMFGYTGATAFTKGELTGFLSSRRSVKLEDLLRHLKMPEVRMRCIDLGVNFGAMRIHVWNERIVGGIMTPTST